MSLEFDSILNQLLPDYQGAIRFGPPQPEPGIQPLPLTGLTPQVPEFIAAAQQFFRGDEPRALLSQWSKVYFRYLILPVCLVAVVTGRRLQAPRADCWLRLRAGVPVGIWLPEQALGPIEPEPLARYRPLCVEHLQPAIDELSQAVRLSPKVLWSNAGTLFELMLGLLADQPQYRSEAQTHARLLFADQSGLFSGRHNWLREPVRYLPPPSPRLPDPMRTRSLCCLRYLLPDEAWCASCPKLHLLKPAELEFQLNRLSGAD